MKYFLLDKSKHSCFSSHVSEKEMLDKVMNLKEIVRVPF
jgi:hypothetical protein